MTQPAVLVVDDDGFIRQALKRSFRKLPVEVFEAENGLQALTLLKNGLNPALIISDIDMPACSGLELAQQCKAEFPSIPMILCSGGAYDLQASALGVKYFDKPVDVKILIEEIRKVLDQNAYPT